jgi:integrase
MPKAKGSKHHAGRITDLQVQRFKGPGKLNVGDGLYLVVTRAGNKRWVFRFSFAGKQQELFIAPVNRLSLADARRKQEEATKLLSAGMDPRQSMDARARRLKQMAAADIPTFGDLADDYLDTLAPTFKNDKARQPWVLSLRTYAAPIRSLRVNAIATAHIVDLLKSIWHTKPETAQRVRRRIEAVFGEAIVRGFRNKDPNGEPIYQRNPAAWRDNLDKTALKRRKNKVKHHAALPYRNIAAFMTNLRNGDSLAARALELCILTVTRTGEIIAAEWDEFDLRHGAWTIPAQRMKAGREHVVPLSRPALELITCLERFQGSPYLFPGFTGDSHLSNMAMSMLLRRTGRDDITVHGFRSSFKDWASEETQFPSEVSEMALAHVIESKVERAYRRGDLFVKRRKLMEAWASFCEPRSANRVLSFKGKAPSKSS